MLTCVVCVLFTIYLKWSSLKILSAYYIKGVQALPSEIGLMDGSTFFGIFNCIEPCDKKLRPARIRDCSMDKLQEALSLMNALCNTSVSIDDISDRLTKDVDEKTAIVKMIDNAKAAVKLQYVKDLMRRVDSVKL